MRASQFIKSEGALSNRALGLIDVSAFVCIDPFAEMLHNVIEPAKIRSSPKTLRVIATNWHTGEADAIPAVGGAMDLATGAKQTWVMMDLLTKQGQSKVVQQCTYPLTGIGCVKRIYTDLCTLACTPQGLRLIDAVPGLSPAELERIIGLPLTL